MQISSVASFVVAGFPLKLVTGVSAIAQSAWSLVHGYFNEGCDQNIVSIICDKKAPELELWPGFKNVDCEDLKILRFMNEFIYDFSMLGDDVASLRSPEDSKNFEAKTLKEFFSEDGLLGYMETEEFWIDIECFIGLVPTRPVRPPIFNKQNHRPAQNINKILLIKWVSERIKAGQSSLTKVLECIKKSEFTTKAKCLEDHCQMIAQGINIMLENNDFSVTCDAFDFRYLKLFKN